MTLPPPKVFITGYSPIHATQFKFHGYSFAQPLEWLKIISTPKDSFKKL